MPPVLSMVSPSALVRGVATGMARRTDARARLSGRLSDRFEAVATVLTDSGTSSLVIAFRMVARKSRVVAIPGFGCPDLVSAAARADVKLRLYDLDPHTLGPDDASVKAVLRRGVDAIVLVHFFGFPVDVAAVAALATEAGAEVIEDAAQGAGGSLNGQLLGSLASLSVLSFGRGKGMAGGGGGALLVRDQRLVHGAERLGPELTRRTAWDGLFATLLQWVFSRPQLYGIPSTIPALRLGEMVFRPAGEPRDLGCGNAELVLDALGRMEEDVGTRTEVARRLLEIVGQGACGVISGGKPGYLRFPVVLPGHTSAARLGILRPYPVTLAELPEARHLLLGGEVPGAGSALLSRALLTLPTHRQVREADLARIAYWADRRQGEGES